MSLDQLDLGLLAVVGLYVAAYVILLVRRRGGTYRETEGVDPFQGWGRY